MASENYVQGLVELAKGNIDLLNDTINVLLVAPTYTLDQSAHNYVSDVNSDEVTNNTGAGYERKTLSNVSVNRDNGNNRVYVDADDVTYSAVDTNEDINAAILFKQVTDDSDSPLIAHLEASDLVANGSDMLLEINANGTFRLNA